jgi:nucleotidyltransferase substrate binding protein (TIGR01987 family)
MQLDISSLEKAIAQVEESLRYATSPQAAKDRRLFVQFRAACIKAFEFTYELSWKTMKRFIEITGPSESQTDVVNFKELLRLALEHDLIRTIDTWTDYREKRNITSHTYQDDKAAQVFAVIPQFLNDAIYLRDQIRRKMAHVP